MQWPRCRIEQCLERCDQDQSETPIFLALAFVLALAMMAVFATVYAVVF